MINKFIDTHCHFDFPPFIESINESLISAQAAGVTDIIIPAVYLSNFERIWQLAYQYPQLHAALGFHPLYLKRFQDNQLETLSDYLKLQSQKCVAVGEIGLDLYMQDPLFELQQRVLIAQLKLAKQFDLPVILHSRKSHDQLAALLRRHPVPACGVVHGFAGSLSQAQAFIKLGYSIGIGGTITYERANKTRKAISQLPPTSLIFETDAPDMPVFGFQGEPNRPERIELIFKSLCEIRDEKPEEIAQQLYINSLSLFNLNK